jgi:hypothetical protein
MGQKMDRRRVLGQRTVKNGARVFVVRHQDHGHTGSGLRKQTVNTGKPGIRKKDFFHWG